MFQIIHFLDFFHGVSKHSICVALNKFFTKDNMRKYVLFGLKHTKEKFCVEIADTLQAINYRIRSKYSEKAAIRKALKEGDKFLGIIDEIILELPAKEKKRIAVIHGANKYVPFFLFFVVVLSF